MAQNNLKNIHVYSFGCYMPEKSGKKTKSTNNY